MMTRILIMGLVLLFMAGSVSAQEVYRWVDDEGNVHFTDKPPEDDRDVDRVRIRSGPGGLDVDAEEDEGNDDMDRRPRLSEAECDGMRSRLDEYQDADVLYRITQEGEQVELEPEVAQAELDRLADQIEAYCD